MIDWIVAMTAGVSPQVMRIHSPAIVAAVKSGYHASRPNAYQFAWAKSWPVQFVSRPVLATPLMLLTNAATWEPGPFAKLSASRNSFHIGARYTRWLDWPRYSWVIWSSAISGVFGVALKSGWNGSRGWKSSGPFL